MMQGQLPYSLCDDCKVNSRYFHLNRGKERKKILRMDWWITELQNCRGCKGHLKSKPPNINKIWTPKWNCTYTQTHTHLTNSFAEFEFEERKQELTSKNHPDRYIFLTIIADTAEMLCNFQSSMLWEKKYPAIFTAERTAEHCLPQCKEL